MRLHGNARTCPKSRRLLAERVLEDDWSLTDVAEAAGVSERTAAKWVARLQAEGEAGLEDRCSAPKRIRHRTSAERVAAIEALRRLRLSAAEDRRSARDGALDCVPLAEADRSGQALAARSAGAAKPLRASPSGRVVHVDVKKLGRFGVTGKRAVGDRHASRGFGWECMRVMVDDCSRVAYAEVLPDERGQTAGGFLRRGLEWFARLASRSSA